VLQTQQVGRTGAEGTAPRNFVRGGKWEPYEGKAPLDERMVPLSRDLSDAYEPGRNVVGGYVHKAPTTTMRVGAYAYNP
jgi:hypothetical protein